jgi:outer membrane protein
MTACFRKRFAVATMVLLSLSGAASGEEASKIAASLRLADALNEALRKSPRLLPGQDAVASAEIQRTIALSRYSPKVSPIVSTETFPDGSSQQNLGISVAQLLPSGAQVKGSVDALRYGAGALAHRDTGYTVGISQPLLRGFGATDRAELRAAARARDGASRSAEDLRQQLVLGVAQAYFAVVRQQRLFSESERALDRATKLGEMAEARARVGLSTQLDVFRAGLFRSQAQAATLGAADMLASAREELSLLIGRPAGASLEVSEDLGADLQTIEAAPTGNQAAAVAARLDVVDARERLADVRDRASVARWNLLPLINLDLSYTRRGLTDPLAAPQAQLQNGWRVGFSSTHALGHAADSAASGLANVAVRAAERALDEAKERAEVDVARATRAVSRASEVMTLYQHSLDLAERQRDLATMRYERGLADNLEVVDAENSVFQAQSALIGADIDRAVSVLTLQRATGALDPNRFLK